MDITSGLGAEMSDIFQNWKSIYSLFKLRVPYRLHKSRIGVFSAIEEPSSIQRERGKCLTVLNLCKKQIGQPLIGGGFELSQVYIPPQSKQF